MTRFPVPAHRNFVGYGPQPPHARWPGGARVAVSLVLNVEEGSEQAVSRGDRVNEHVYDMVDLVDGGPNLTMESHFDYGLRAGMEHGNYTRATGITAVRAGLFTGRRAFRWRQDFGRTT